METSQQFWARVSQQLTPAARDGGYTERRIGNSPEIVDQVLDPILRGEKTGTFSLPDELAKEGPLPRPGDHIVLTRFDGSAACLVVMEACEEIPFNKIGADHIQVEAVAVRDLKRWRDFHRQYWGAVQAAKGASFGDSQIILAQRFRLLAEAETPP